MRTSKAVLPPLERIVLSATSVLRSKHQFWQRGEEKASAELILNYRNHWLRDELKGTGQFIRLSSSNPPPHCCDSYLCSFKGCCLLAHSYINKREPLAVLAVLASALVCLAALALPCISALLCAGLALLC